MEDVEVRHTTVSLGIAGIERFDFVILRMPTTGCDQLILFQRFDILGWKQADQLGNWISWTGEGMCHHDAVNKLAPKSTVIVSPTATVKVAP